MVDPIMYQEDGYVVLETNRGEELLTESELLARLEGIVESLSPLPEDVAKFPTVREKAVYLLHNYCQLSLDENHYIQWYVVRWQKR